MNLNDWVKFYNETALCPICQTEPELITYTYYYGEKSSGEYETIRQYVCPKCGFGKTPDDRGQIKVVREITTECNDEMIKRVARACWNRLVKDQNEIFKHFIITKGESNE